MKTYEDALADAKQMAEDMGLDVDDDFVLNDLMGDWI